MGVGRRDGSGGVGRSVVVPVVVGRVVFDKNRRRF